MRRRGLTLVEVLVVLALAGLLAAWTIPEFGRGARRQELAAAASAARDMLGTLRVMAAHDPYPPDDPPSPPEFEPRYEYRLEVVDTRVLQVLREIQVVDLQTGLGTLRGSPEVRERLRLPEGATAEVEPPGPLVFDRYGRATRDATLTLQGMGRTYRLAVRAGQPQITLEGP